MLNANEVGGGPMKKELLEAGVYPGRLVQVIDMGMQEQRDWQGEAKGPKYELMVTYEFSDEFMKDEEDNDLLDKPRWLSETFPFFNLGAEKAKSTLRYKALDPNGEKKGAWSELLGTACNITVIINKGKGNNVGKFYENIAGIAPMRAKDAEKCPPLVNPVRVFDLDRPDLDVFDALPEWIRDKIKANLEFNGSPLAVLLGTTVSDDRHRGEPSPAAVEAESESVVAAVRAQEDDDEIPF